MIDDRGRLYKIYIISEIRLIYLNFFQFRLLFLALLIARLPSRRDRIDSLFLVLGNKAYNLGVLAPYLLESFIRVFENFVFRDSFGQNFGNYKLEGELQTRVLDILPEFVRPLLLLEFLLFGRNAIVLEDVLPHLLYGDLLFGGLPFLFFQVALALMLPYAVFYAFTQFLFRFGLGLLLLADVLLGFEGCFRGFTLLGLEGVVFGSFSFLACPFGALHFT